MYQISGAKTGIGVPTLSVELQIEQVRYLRSLIWIAFAQINLSQFAVRSRGASHGNLHKDRHVVDPFRVPYKRALRSAQGPAQWRVTASGELRFMTSYLES